MVLTSGTVIDLPLRVQDMEKILDVGPNEDGWLEFFGPGRLSNETYRYNVRPMAIAVWWRMTHASDTERHTR